MLITDEGSGYGEQGLGGPGDPGRSRAARGPRGVRRAGRAVPADGLRDRAAAAGQRQRCAGADAGGVPARTAADRPAPRAGAVRRLAAAGRRADGDQPGDAAGRRRRASRSGILEGASEHSDEPLDQLISRERAERLWEALGRLKSLDREALDAFYIRGHSLLEIAEMLNVPAGHRQAAAAHRAKAAEDRARGLGRRRPGVDRRTGRRLRSRSSTSRSRS